MRYARRANALRKSRARTLHINDRGEYRIVDPDRNLVVAGERFDMTLAAVEKWIESR